MRYPEPGPRGPAGPKEGSVGTSTFNETQCARRATSSINSPCLVSYRWLNFKKFFTLAQILLFRNPT